MTSISAQPPAINTASSAFSDESGALQDAQDQTTKSEFQCGNGFYADKGTKFRASVDGLVADLLPQAVRAANSMGIRLGQTAADYTKTDEAGSADVHNAGAGA